jgi:phosphohistidine phosphatase
MRHAAAAPHATSDAERSLTPRGRTSATQAGAFLRDLGVRPDHVLVSPAVRCTETWELVRAELGPGPEIVEQVEEGLYASAPDSLLDVLRAAPDEARTVMLVGHNPSVAYLASVIADADGPMEVMQSLLNGMLPGAVAVYETDLPWRELDMLGARATHVLEGASG